MNFFSDSMVSIPEFHFHLVKVLAGLLIAFFAHVAGLGYKAHLHRFRSVQEGFVPLLMSSFFCVAAVMVTSSYVGLSVADLMPGGSLSMIGLLAAVIMTMCLFAVLTTTLYVSTDRPIASRLLFGFFGGVCLLVAHAGFLVFPRINLSLSVNWPALGSTALVSVVVLLWFSRFLMRAMFANQFTNKFRLNVALGLAVLNLFIASGIAYSVEFGQPATRMWNHILPIDAGHYWVGMTFVGTIIVFTVLFTLYQEMQAQVSNLIDLSVRLEGENQSYQDGMHQANLQSEIDNVRILALEEAVRTNESEKGVPTDSLVTAFLTLQDGVFDWDLSKDQVCLSKPWYTLLGLPDSQDNTVQVDCWLKGFIESDVVELDRAVEALVGTSQALAKFQMRYQQPEGGVLKIEFKMVAVRNAYGLVSKFVGIMEDRTAEMLIEMDVLENLSEESKLSSRKSEFVTYLSHQIRTPMTVISSANALLEAGLRYKTLSDERLYSHIDQLDYALSLLRSLVDESLIFIGSDGMLLDLQSNGAVDINALLSEVLEIETKRRSQSLPAGFEIKRQIPDDFKVHCSEIMLGHVFRQFISFVFDNPMGSKGMFVSTENGKLFLQVLYTSVPEWVRRDELNKSTASDPYSAGDSIIPIDEDSLPFALLLSKRVIRNLKGRLILRRVVNQLSMTVEIPLIKEEKLICPE